MTHPSLSRNTVTAADEPDRITAERRSVSVEWDLGIDQGEHEVAVLSIFHHGDRKQYAASLGRERRTSTSRSFAIFASVRVLSEPCPRYNAKTQLLFAYRAIEALREAISDPKVIGIFRDPWTFRATIAAGEGHEQHDGKPFEITRAVDSADNSHRADELPVFYAHISGGTEYVKLTADEVLAS